MANGTATAQQLKKATAGVILPLALAQFIASFAATNMNVAINSIANDLGTSVRGVQTVITLFTLTMAALMIPGSKLTDLWGRKFCLMLGLVVYGLGATLAAFTPSLLLLVVGYSLLEGVGSALMIPPIYILVTVLFTESTIRAKNIGIISAAGGIGAAAGPLLGGLITSAISWRASFAAQALVVTTIIYLTSRFSSRSAVHERPAFDIGGALLSAVGLVFAVIGILMSGTYGWFRSRQDFTIGNSVILHANSLSPVWLFVGIGALILWWFFAHIRKREQAGKAPLLSTRLLRNRVSNLGLVTQNAQWLIMQGSFFVVSVFLQTVRSYNAIQTGLILTPATIGILATSAVAARLARRYAQPRLIQWGFMATMLGLALLLLFARAESSILWFVPGLLVVGLGVGVMLTSSVNVVQSAFTDKDQGEISGLSRSVSNLGSSLGTALAGSILVSTLVKGNYHFVLALLVMLAISTIGLLAAWRISVKRPKKVLRQNVVKANT